MDDTLMKVVSQNSNPGVLTLEPSLLNATSNYISSGLSYYFGKRISLGTPVKMPYQLFFKIIN